MVLKMEQLVVGLHDAEETVVIDNRDWNETLITCRGAEWYIKRDHLNNILESTDHAVLADAGVEVFTGQHILVLYLEDIRYLLENMDENDLPDHPVEKTAEQVLLELAVKYLYDLSTDDQGTLDWVIEETGMDEGTLFDTFETLSQTHEFDLDEQ
jgi:hypothetical protein